MAAWSIGLGVCGSSRLDTESLAASLATECEVEWISASSFETIISEVTCRDLRAMWNTRMRGLIATDNVLKVLGKHS